MNVIYCLVPASYWANYEGQSEYLPRDYEQEGFIHATRGDDLLVGVMNRVYSDFTDRLLLLVIEEGRVTSEVKYEEASDGNLYPHIYGPLNTSAILEVRQMHRGSQGWTLS